MNFLTPENLIGWALLAALIAITVTAIFALRALKPLLEANLKGKMYETLRSRAKTFVGALMQDPTLKGLADEDKKQQAVIWMLSFAAQFGIPLTASDASKLIEEAVYLLKNVALPEVVDVLE